MVMDFSKYFDFLKKKLKEMQIADPQSDCGTGFNMGAETMFHYGMIVLMDIQNEYTREKIHAARNATKKVSA